MRIGKPLLLAIQLLLRILGHRSQSLRGSQPVYGGPAWSRVSVSATSSVVGHQDVPFDAFV